MFGKISTRIICLMASFASAASLMAQGTAFNYQGQLMVGGASANGNYDLTFGLYNSTNLAASLVTFPVTNSAVAVTNGLFTATLNFGAGIFTGTNFWLEVAVRTNGTGAFSKLSPRQPLPPVPYAIFANSASNLLGSFAATQLSGTLPSAQISGSYTSAVTFNNAANVFAGTFSGDGAGLNNLNGSRLTTGTVADARLSPNVALLNANQTFTGSNTFTGNGTFTGTNNFSGVNAFTNFGNSFRGSFFGNGLVGWIPTGATAVQAVSDTGYLLLSSQLVKLTLPVSPVVGDIVRISGAGAGGWQVVPNPSQSFFGNFASFSNSYQVSLQSSTFANNYSGVAASIDGTRVYAVGSGITWVSASSDSGRTWSQVGGSFSSTCQSVACSANGRIVYAVTTTGSIWQSLNGGATWSGITGSATTSACTADGSQFFTGGIACSGNGTFRAKLSGGNITISTNGTSSFSVTVISPATGVTCLGVSGDCTRLVAGVSNGLLYGSANAGATWSIITTTNQFFAGAWMSQDGSKFATAVSTSGSIVGGIYNYAVSPLPGTATNSLAGSQGSAVELQYTGGGQFMPVSSAGTIWGN